MSDSRLWVMVSQDYAKPNRTWQKIKKELIEKLRITKLLKLLKSCHIYIYIIIIIITKYTFVNLVIQKFQKSTSEEYCSSKNI